MALRTPVRWLQDFVDCPLTPEELAERLTISGMEVEGVESIGASWGDRCFVGQVREVVKHPDADSLSLVTVDYGESSLQLVTGAPNIRELEGGLLERPVKVALALSGAKLINPYKEGNPLTELKPSKIRGIRSEGMVCSELELGIGESHEGVLLLPEDAPVGMSLRDYLGDSVLHFDIKGGFAHLLSILGIARETAAILDLPLKREVLPELSRLQVLEQPEFVGLEIPDPDLCPRYSAVLVRGARVQPSPFWMQQRLLRCGMRPINNIVDITNYVMLELGQPLHAFDYQGLCQRAGGGRPTIIVRRAQEGEVLQTLDEVDRQLDSEMLMITDTAGLIAIAGVMGGADTEVTEQTTDILIEAASFEFLNNRRTVQQLKLRTEAAERFGKQLDPDGTLLAALRAAELMVEFGGGVLEPVAGDLYPGRPEPTTLRLDPQYVNRLLGIELPVEEMIRILRALEFTVTPGALLDVGVPNHRQDVRIPADLVEEIVRVHGYTELPATLIRDELPPQRPNPSVEHAERARDLLTGLGLDEVITYSMVDPRDEARLAFQETPDLKTFVPLKNPLSQERTHLRRTLLPGAIQTLRSNLRFLERVAIFEIGSVFHPQPGQVLPEEPRRLSVLMSGVRSTPGWEASSEDKLEFFDLKGVLEEFFQALHLDVDWRPATEAPYHPGRCAALFLGETLLGHAGELHPKLRAEFSLPEQPVCVAQLDFGAMIELSGSGHQMQDISAFTPVFEDFAVVVDASVPASQVEDTLRQGGAPLIREARLFDVYQGTQVPEGKKSLAYAVTYQAMDRTLGEKEIEKARKRIVRKLEQELGATLRG